MSDSLLQIRFKNIELLIFPTRTSFLQKKLIEILRYKGTFSKWYNRYVSNEVRIYIKIPFSKNSLFIFLKKETKL